MQVILLSDSNFTKKESQQMKMKNLNDWLKKSVILFTTRFNLAEIFQSHTTIE